MNDATDELETSSDSEGSEGTPETRTTNPADEIASYRKRQAGAEAARQAAEAKAREYEAELAKYRAAAQTEEQKDLSELAREKALREQAEERAATAEAKAQAKILDARFPNARAELPEVTDEVRLAKFEAMLAGDPDPGTPERHNESRSSSTGTREAKEETAAEVKARLLVTPLPTGWQ